MTKSQYFWKALLYAIKVAIIVAVIGLGVQKFRADIYEANWKTYLRENNCQKIAQIEKSDGSPLGVYDCDHRIVAH